MGVNKKSIARNVRREELQRFISERGKVDYIFDLLDKLEDESTPMEGIDLQRVSKAIDTRLALLKKYLPDMKAIEHTGEEGGPIKGVILNKEEYAEVRKQMLDKDDC